ncbi:MAG: PilZ domain-containing protein [Candidatus Omnitrophota bacterium]|nr:PilZ domain-containing protein [Candidatus Omnitrophota bacterium]
MEVNEKRSCSRFGCRVPILCRKGTLFDNSQTMDISKGGVGLISSKFIPLNSNLVMEIALSPKSEPLLAVGKVKWVQKLGSQERYRVGMAFTDISAQAGNRLEDYLGK